MKMIPVLLITALLTACGGDNKNELMTKFINEKKVLEDSIKYYRGSESMYKEKVSEIAHATHDTLKYLPVLDTQFMYSNLAFKCEQTLKDIDFSIDSLSKMK